MNLVGRYLEEGWEVERNEAAAFDWYRRAAEAGDPRGQASYAWSLLEQGRINEALGWLRRAIASGSASFLQYLLSQLVESDLAELRAMAGLAEGRLKSLLAQSHPADR